MKKLLLGLLCTIALGAYANPADDAANVRCASRAHTEYDKWLKTDPQNPKSIWWFSDMKGIGFRVVCELPQGVSAN